MLIKCPRCQKQIEYSPQNVYRPFCSQRCRDIDLGKWIEGHYAVPGEKADLPTQSANDPSLEDSED